MQDLNNVDLSALVWLHNKKRTQLDTSLICIATPLKGLNKINATLLSSCSYYLRSVWTSWGNDHDHFAVTVKRTEQHYIPRTVYKKVSHFLRLKITNEKQWLTKQLESVTTLGSTYVYNHPDVRPFNWLLSKPLCLWKIYQSMLSLKMLPLCSGHLKQ